MATTYRSLEELHQAYASEPDRVTKGWNYWSDQGLPDGSIEVTVTQGNGTTEVWTRAAGQTTLNVR